MLRKRQMDAAPKRSRCFRKPRGCMEQMPRLVQLLLIRYIKKLLPQNTFFLLDTA